MPKSSFNAEAFMQAKHKGALDTKLPVVPIGEYRLQLERLVPREQEVKKGERKGETIVILDVIWEVLDERLKELLNMAKVTVRQSLFLDLTPEGQLDFGKAKNVALGRLREALGQNDPKKEWFPNMMLGAIVKGKVDHQPNEEDPTSPFSKVTSVAPLS